MADFTPETVSDQKRAARGEQLRFARTLLRARDGVHHRAWRVLMTAGGAPSEEINCLRELMFRCEIVAVDRDPECTEAACEAGADVAICCDLFDFLLPNGQGDQRGARAPRDILRAGGKARFDLIDIDLCRGAGADLGKLSSIYNRSALSLGGVFIVTFSYGRDVVERFGEAAHSVHEFHPVRRLCEDLDEVMQARIASVMPNAWKRHAALRSVVLYRGNAMPMCSVLWSKSSSVTSETDGSRQWLGPQPKVIRLADDDLEGLVLWENDDPALVYATPHDRIESMRRSRAARRAARTSQIRREMRRETRNAVPVDGGTPL